MGANLISNLADPGSAQDAATKNYVDNSVNAEMSRAMSAESSLSAAISSEMSRAMSVEAGLSSDISAEVSRAMSAEGSLASSIAAETSRALAAEGSLSAAIAAETSRALAAEATYLPLAGGTMSGDLNLGGHKLTSVSEIDVTLAALGAVVVFDSTVTARGNMQADIANLYLTSNPDTNMWVSSASATGSTNSGVVHLQSGATADGNSGDLQIQSGQVTGSGNSGNIHITTGAVSGGTRGNVLMSLGSGYLDMGGSLISNLQNPVSPQDAATKAIVDAETSRAEAAEASLAAAIGAATGNVASWAKYTVPYTSLNSGSSVSSALLLSLPAKGTIHEVVIHHTTAFAAPTLGSLTVEVGVVSETDRYASAFDVSSAVTGSNLQHTYSGGVENFASATNINVTARITGDVLSNLSAGSVDIYVLTSVLP
jgi:hypothetical protein